MKVASLLTVIALLGFGGLLYFAPGNEIDFATKENYSTRTVASTTPASITNLEQENLVQATEVVRTNIKYNDIPLQKPLSNPPEIIKAIYGTGWSAGSSKKVDYFIDLIKSTELNAIVIDIKDFSGHILYDIQNEDAIRYGAKKVQIPRINALIKKLHDEDIYVIARQTVFQDPVLARARPGFTVQKDVIATPAIVETNGTTTTIITATTTKRVIWLDNKGLGWIDPGAVEAWDYNIAIAKDAAARGFDEINFDYIRFPSDGVIADMRFPHYNLRTTLKLTQIQKFFEYLRKEMAGIAISADLFGLVTVNNGDLGIGQNLKTAAPNFDAIAPMVYPSHYAKGFMGFQNPGAYPYEVVRYSMEKAREKLTIYDKKCMDQEKTSGTSTVTEEVCEIKTSFAKAKLRPWLQDFDLGADYDAEKVRSQITAVDEILKNTPLYDGWMIWAPSNVYTRGALNPE